MEELSPNKCTPPCLSSNQEWEVKTDEDDKRDAMVAQQLEQKAIDKRALHCEKWGHVNEGRIKVDKQWKNNAKRLMQLANEKKRRVAEMMKQRRLQRLKVRAVSYEPTRDQSKHTQIIQTHRQTPSKQKHHHYSYNASTLTSKKKRTNSATRTRICSQRGSCTRLWRWPTWTGPRSPTSEFVSDASSSLGRAVV